MTIGNPRLKCIFSLFFCISLSPWFNWHENAISDLGNCIYSPVAPDNLTILIAGFILAFLSLCVLYEQDKLSGYSLATSDFLLQVVGAFDEVYGALHYAAAVLFFVSLQVSLLIYSTRRKSISALAAFIVGLSTWILYWAGVFSIAVSEMGPVAVVSAWIFRKAFFAVKKSS